MKSIYRMLSLGTLLLAAVPACDPSNWCLHPFTSSCSSGTGGGDETPGIGTKASGVNVLDCMVGDNPDFPGRAYTVWATEGDGWLGPDQISTMSTGQVCDDPMVIGNKTSIVFPDVGNWTVRLVKIGLDATDGCDSSVPNSPTCSAANDDFFDTPFAADPSSPMATITMDKDF